MALIRDYVELEEGVPRKVIYPEDLKYCLELLQKEDGKLCSEISKLIGDSLDSPPKNALQIVAKLLQIVKNKKKAFPELYSKESKGDEK